mgnify:FL=1
MKRTSSYDYLWRRSFRGDRRPTSYHYERMLETLDLPPLQGIMLDAGCGEGIDLANRARDSSGVKLIGVERSTWGCRASQERVRHYASAHVVQADLCQLPFGSGIFDFIYSYGVLHHLSEPGKGLQELVRVLKPGRRIALYLYEDFRDRHPLWRGLLWAAGRLRSVTTWMPHRLLYALCVALSPWIYFFFALPYRILRRIPACRSAAEGIPFRHAAGPFALPGDLFDRFATPIEWRYSRDHALDLMHRAGLEEVRVTQ